MHHLRGLYPPLWDLVKAKLSHKIILKFRRSSSRVLYFICIRRHTMRLRTNSLRNGNDATGGRESENKYSTYVQKSHYVVMKTGTMYESVANDTEIGYFIL